VLALSRRGQAPKAGVEWLCGSLQAMPPLPADIDCVLSLGPLDAFATWFAGCESSASRVIALSSTGRIDKLHSIDPVERDLARRLQEAEDILFDAGTRRSVAITLLRPTLLYGSDRDRSVSRLVRIADRCGFMVLPSSATGLRQPVHVLDVAAAIIACLASAGTCGQAFDLPGGERLPFDRMVRRVLAQSRPGCKVLSAPTWLFQIGVRIAALVGRAPFSEGLLDRLMRDQVADSGPAERAFGYRPRRFEPGPVQLYAAAQHENNQVSIR
jgi:nucleoside-diphosphate-sugar epimerase